MSTVHVHGYVLTPTTNITVDVGPTLRDPNEIAVSVGLFTPSWNIPMRPDKIMLVPAHKLLILRDVPPRNAILIDHGVENPGDLPHTIDVLIRLCPGDYELLQTHMQPILPPIVPLAMPPILQSTTMGNKEVRRVLWCNGYHISKDEQLVNMSHKKKLIELRDVFYGSFPISDVSFSAFAGNLLSFPIHNESPKLLPGNGIRNAEIYSAGGYNIVCLQMKEYPFWIGSQSLDEQNQSIGSFCERIRSLVMQNVKKRHLDILEHLFYLFDVPFEYRNLEDAPQNMFEYGLYLDKHLKLHPIISVIPGTNPIYQFPGSDKSNLQLEAQIRADGKLKAVWVIKLACGGLLEHRYNQKEDNNWREFAYGYTSTEDKEQPVLRVIQESIRDENYEDVRSVVTEKVTEMLEQSSDSDSSTEDFPDESIEQSEGEEEEVEQRKGTEGASKISGMNEEEKESTSTNTVTSVSSNTEQSPVKEHGEEQKQQTHNEPPQKKENPNEEQRESKREKNKGKEAGALSGGARMFRTAVTGGIQKVHKRLERMTTRRREREDEDTPSTSATASSPHLRLQNDPSILPFRRDVRGRQSEAQASGTSKPQLKRRAIEWHAGDYEESQKRSKGAELSESRSDKVVCVDAHLHLDRVHPKVKLNCVDDMALLIHDDEISRFNKYEVLVVPNFIDVGHFYNWSLMRWISSITQDPRVLGCSIGVHPLQAGLTGIPQSGDVNTSRPLILSLFEHFLNQSTEQNCCIKKIKGLGETGFDLSDKTRFPGCTKEAQSKSLRTHARLCLRYNLTLTLHIREGNGPDENLDALEDDTIKILTEEERACGRKLTIIYHYFHCHLDSARDKWAKNFGSNIFFGINTVRTSSLHAATTIYLNYEDNVVLESDAPYGNSRLITNSPIGSSRLFSGRSSTQWSIIPLAQRMENEISRNRRNTRRISATEILRKCCENTKKAFNTE